MLRRIAHAQWSFKIYLELISGTYFIFFIYFLLLFFLFLFFIIIILFLFLFCSVASFLFPSVFCIPSPVVPSLLPASLLLPFPCTILMNSKIPSNQHPINYSMQIRGYNDDDDDDDSSQSNANSALITMSTKIKVNPMSLIYHSPEYSLTCQS